MSHLSQRPAPAEHAPYYARYIDLVSDGDILKTLESQAAATGSLLRPIEEERSLYRYAPGKWSIREVIGHVTDAERVFAYRALAFSRGDSCRLPSFDENAYVQTGGFDRVPMRELVDGFVAVRRSTLALLRAMPDEAWDYIGVASDNAISVRALAFVMAGHELHHIRVVREHYLAG